ncbi:MAG: hypothetical protein QXN55_04845 [Candidatus Nitrosotenuis sp.]
MHYVRKSPIGICSFYVIKIKNIIRIFGIILTRKNKILFSHQISGKNYKTTYIIQKREEILAICQ